MTELIFGAISWVVIARQLPPTFRALRIRIVEQSTILLMHQRQWNLLLEGVYVEVPRLEWIKSMLRWRVALVAVLRDDREGKQTRRSRIVREGDAWGTITVELDPVGELVDTHSLL